MQKLLLILVIGLPLAAFVGGMKYQEQLNRPDGEVVESATYKNSRVRFGFSHPVSLTVDECADKSCAMIDALSLRVQALDSETFPLTDPLDNLAGYDLFCAADGPQGGVACQTTRVEPVTTLRGMTGFKLYRHKTFTGSHAGEIEDSAYVFPVAHESYSGILLAVDDASVINLAALKTIADSFYTY